jgi:hypothetical protein
MNLKICAAAAAVIVCAATAAVAASNKPANNLRAIQIECIKQYGGYEDPQTKRIMFPTMSVTGAQGMVDAIHACVAQKTGKPVTPFMRSDTTIR